MSKKNIMNSSFDIKKTIINRYWEQKLEGKPQFAATSQTQKAISKEICIKDLSYFLKISNGSVGAEESILLNTFSLFICKYLGTSEFTIYTNGISVGNTLTPPLLFAINIDDELSVKENLINTKKEVEETLAHYKYDFDNTSTNQNLKRLESLSLFQFVYGEIGNEEDYHPLTFCYHKNGLEKVNITLLYSPDFIDASIAELFFDNIQSALIYLDRQLDLPLSELPILHDSDRKLILDDFNNTKAAYSDDKTIIQLFEEQVSLNPNSTALISDEIALTYLELNEKANQLAHYLRKKYEIRANDLIAIKLPRTHEMIIAIFGVIKSGAAYVPIDPNYPLDRIEYLETDSGCKLTLDIEELKTFYLELEKYPVTNPILINSTRDLIYVIYTSGTTGNPKGVMIEHTSLVNRLEWMQKFCPLDKNDVLIQKTSYAFDVSVWEIFWWALYGAKLIVPRDGVEKNPKLLVDGIKNHGVTVIHFVPSMLSIFLDYLKEFPLEITRVTGLNQVFVSGEALTTYIKDGFYKSLKATKLINLYGPTEACIDVSYYDCANGSTTNSVPIGKPIDNTTLLILDHFLNIVPIGIKGNLYITGIGLSRGYLNRPELTKEKFIDNPYCADSKLYKSGDLARWLPDGNIEFLGRTDDQIKIRGYRIELQEVEKVLLSYSTDISQAIINLQDLGHQRKLVAFYISKVFIDREALKKHMQQKLPDYMVPLYFAPIEQIPLSSNGKLNRKLLPIIGEESITREEFIIPKTKVENELATIWREVLGIDKIGVKDDFFALGGNSLLFVKAYLEFKNRFSYNINLTQFYSSTTIEQQALFVKIKSNSQSKTRVAQILKMPNYINYYWEKARDTPKSKNISFGISTTSKLDFDRLTLAFTKLCNIHSILRSNVEEVDGNYYFKKSKKLNKLKKIVGLSNDEINNNAYEIHTTKFDYFLEPLIRGYVFENEDQTLLLFCIPHLIFDGLSEIILLRDFFMAYSDLNYNKVLESQFVESGLERQREAIQNEKPHSYWKEFFSKEIKPICFNLEHIIDETSNPSIEVSFKLESDIEQQITALCKSLKISYNTFFSSVISIIIYIETRQETFALCFDHHSRTEQTVNQIGFWVQSIFTQIKIKKIRVDEFLLDINSSINNAMENSYRDILQDIMTFYGDNFEEKLNELKKVRFNYYEESSLDIDLANLTYKHVHFKNVNLVPIYLHFFVANMNHGIDVSILANTQHFSESYLKQLKIYFETICHTILKNGEGQPLDYIFKTLRTTSDFSKSESA